MRYNSVQWLAFKPLLRTICQKVLCLVCYLLTPRCQVVITRRNTSKQNWSPWLDFSGRSRKRNHKHQWLGFTRVCWEAFEIYRCQSETYGPVFCTGDLGMVDCGGDLLSQRKQALCILSGAGIQGLVRPASSAGEWIPKAYVKPGRRPKTWKTSVWCIAAWFVNQSVIGNFTQTSLSFGSVQQLWVWEK